MVRLLPRSATVAVVAAAALLMPLAASDHTSDSCPIPCHHGRCVELELGTTYKCDCDPPDKQSTSGSYSMIGYSGPSCDIPYEQCPDYERRCYNNARCTMSPSDPGKFVCDCGAAYDVSAFAGHECQYSATEVCEAGTPVSEDAFCVNGGKCRSTVMAGEDHPGCDCPEEFEGSKCQYLKGTAPAEEFGSSSRSKSNSQGGSRPRGEGTEDLHPGIIAAIVIVALAVVGGFGYMIYAKRRGGIEAEGAVVDKEGTIESDGFANDDKVNISGQDLELHPDGSGTMMGVADEKTDVENAEGGGGDGNGEGDGVKVDMEDAEML